MASHEVKVQDLLFPKQPRTASPLEMVALFQDWMAFDDPVAKWGLYLFFGLAIVPTILGLIVILLGLHNVPKSPLKRAQWYLPYPLNYFLFERAPVSTLKTIRKAKGDSFKFAGPSDDISVFLQPGSVDAFLKLPIANVSTMHAFKSMYPALLNADTVKHIASWRNLVRKDILLQYDDYELILSKLVNERLGDWLSTDDLKLGEFSSLFSTQVLMTVIGGPDFAQEHAHEWSQKLSKMELKLDTFYMKNFPELPFGGNGYAGKLLKEMHAILSDEIEHRQSALVDGLDNSHDHIAAYLKSDLSKGDLTAFASHVVCFMLLTVIEMKGMVSWLIIKSKAERMESKESIEKTMIQIGQDYASPLVIRRTGSSNVQFMGTEFQPFSLLAISPRLAASENIPTSSQEVDNNEEKLTPFDRVFMQSYTPEMGPSFLAPLLVKLMPLVFDELVKQSLSVTMDPQVIECHLTRLPILGLKVPSVALSLSKPESKKDQ